MLVCPEGWISEGLGVQMTPRWPAGLDYCLDGSPLGKWIEVSKNKLGWDQASLNIQNQVSV